MEKEQAQEYEQLNIYVTLVVKAGIKVLRIKSNVNTNMTMAGTFKRTSLVKALNK